MIMTIGLAVVAIAFACLFRPLEKFEIVALILIASLFCFGLVMWLGASYESKDITVSKIAYVDKGMYVVGCNGEVYTTYNYYHIKDSILHSQGDSATIEYTVRPFGIGVEVNSIHWNSTKTPIACS